MAPALAALLALVPAGARGADIVVPAAHVVAGNSSSSGSFTCQQPQRIQQVYRGSELGAGTMTITHIAFRTAPGSAAFVRRYHGATIRLSSTANGPDALSATFGDNVGADERTVLSVGDLTVSGSASPAVPLAALPFNVVLALQVPFTFDAAAGTNLLLDATFPGCSDDGAADVRFDAAFAEGDAVSRVVGDADGVRGGRDTRGLVTRFTTVPAGAPPPSTTLVAAVLPSARAVRVGTAATVRATIINSGHHPALAVGILVATGLRGSFAYRATDCATGALTGGENVPVDIPPGAAACFVLSITPQDLGPTFVPFAFGGTNTAPVPVLDGVNNLVLSASAAGSPDLVAVAATSSGDGILEIPGATGSAAFTVAAANVGAGGLVTVVPFNTFSTLTALPLTLGLCQTDPVSGQCTSPIAPRLTTRIEPGATPTFAVFATAAAAVPFDPGRNRIFIGFTDGAGGLRGLSSVAVRTR